jgi:hypothetical protein
MDQAGARLPSTQRQHREKALALCSDGAFFLLIWKLGLLASIRHLQSKAWSTLIVCEFLGSERQFKVRLVLCVAHKHVEVAGSP